ncbi:hypothetical protein SFRURICE_014054 [Spodoptera frugiperda]|nr:hypothetical protein SFRURICE_014054 [Spodoptera frugiperda]
MSQTGVGVVSQLNITRVRVEDGGLYSCLALEGDSNTGHSSRIDVFGPPYIRTLPPIKVQSGEPLKLRCPYYGYPISSTLPQHSRYKRTYSTTSSNSKNTRRKRKKRQLFETGADGVLNKPRVSKEENGDTYTCIVYSPSGEMARRSFEIQVVEAPELDELRVGSGLKEGQIVQITCNIISGDPPIYFSWLKDGMKLPASLKITERSSDLFSVLIIKRVSLEHCGKYTIRSTEIVFINSLSPTATLGIWRPVLDLAGGGVMSYPNGTLIIEVVSLSDEGMYACNPVHFESVGTNLTTKMGLPVTLTCRPLGDNPIRVKWALDGKPIDFTSSRVTISETMTRNGLNSLININYVESRDGGTYECRASNPYGVAAYNPPTPPLDLQVDSVTSNSVKLSWRDTISTHVQYYTLQYTTNDFMMWDTAKSMNITRQENDVRQSIELRDLQPAMDYRVRIASGNQVDLSPYTQPVHFSTQQEAPSSTPLGVQVQQTENPGELIVSWLPPPRESHNGQLQGYHVKAVPRISGDPAPELPPSGVECRGVSSSSLRIAWQPITAQGASLLGYSVYYSTEDGPWQNMSSSHTELYLQALLKYTNYTVKVAGFSNYGLGPFSYPIVCTTLQDVPGPPAAIKVLVSSPTSLLVSWKRPEEANGDISHYTVYVKPVSSTSSPQNYRVESTQETNLRHLTFPVSGLSTGRQYEVFVRAHTAVGEGTPSNRVHIDLTSKVVAGVASLGGPVSVGVGSSLLLVCQFTRNHDDSLLINSKCSSSCYTARRRRAPCGTTNTTSSRTIPGSPGTIFMTSLASINVSVLLHHLYALYRAPPPRTPVFTRNHDDSLLINSKCSSSCYNTARRRRAPCGTTNTTSSRTIPDIDQSLSGNYTCLAKNLYGSDSVSYEVLVLPTPEPPSLRVTSHKNAIHLQWELPRKIGGKSQKISYNLTWKEANGSWQDAWSSKGTSLQGTQEYTLQGLKCGTKYSLRMTAANSVGSSQPTYMDATTLGGVPISPTSTEWFWSNATHIYIQLSGWDDNGCEITRFDVEYKEYGSKTWKKAENRLPSIDQAWSHYVPSSILAQPNSFVLAELVPAQWYHVRVTAENAAGISTSMYSYATTTVQGESVGPPSDFFDLNMLVIICSSILLMICSLTCVYILVKRHNHQHLTEYRNSLTAECKSERSNMTVNTPQSVPSDMNNRVYSTPVHLTAENKHELYEISPYAQFAIGFRTFGHVDNQEVPNRVHLPGNSKSRYDSETSFQMRSESEESDCVSRTTTLKSVPRSKNCIVTMLYMIFISHGVCKSPRIWHPIAIYRAHFQNPPPIHGTYNITCEKLVYIVNVHFGIPIKFLCKIKFIKKIIDIFSTIFIKKNLELFSKL